jgi:hypothetical protein
VDDLLAALSYLDGAARKKSVNIFLKFLQVQRINVFHRQHGKSADIGFDN